MQKKGRAWPWAREAPQKFGIQLGFAKAHHKTTPREEVGVAMSWGSSHIFGVPVCYFCNGRAVLRVSGASCFDRTDRQKPDCPVKNRTPGNPTSTWYRDRGAQCPDMMINFSTPCLSQKSFEQGSAHLEWRLYKHRQQQQIKSCRVRGLRGYGVHPHPKFRHPVMFGYHLLMSVM